ncbi:sensor histidine kinase [Amycolatopsis sp. 195334CR]|uniref:sensor histidine kinase n=1 Tax=Amycolatopsis sp. 195334CR TaxID=2814588 RepID=UPI001A8C8B05|nr:ATP-binding protein [Amycolatopsis sp. 195334CR]MBN6037719.1 ATP-binding protein [Amycolatopsis sp. 195334CR]
MPSDRDTSVEAESLAVVGRFAGMARGAGLLVISAFGVLATPAEALPLAFGLLALAVVAALAEFYTGHTGRGRPLTFTLTLVRAAAICAAQIQTAPVPGELNQWALNVLTITVITLQWEWPPRLTVPAVACLLVVQLAPLAPEDAVSTVVRVLIEGVLARLAFLLLLRTTRRIDRLRDRRARLQREESLALERKRQEREYLAVLHDTASATFLMVAQRGETADPAKVAEYASRDLSILTGASGRDSMVELEASLRGVLEQSPVLVDARWTPVPLLPASAALALVRAVREALVNVERHAGVNEAVLTVEAGVRVSIRDTGRGFDPDAVPAHRRGIRGSLVERMAAVGGRATVTSAPGAGTTVELVWPDG